MKTEITKIAVISGGAGGIGRAVVLRLVEDGCFPVILDKNQGAGQQVLAEVKQRGKQGECIAAELAKKAEVGRAFEKIISSYGRVDVLVTLAGGSLYAKPMQEYSLKEWQEVVDANLRATFLCCQAVLETMKQQKKGAIVNTASNLAITGSVGRSPYTASKAAIIGFTKSLAREVAPYGIRANCIAPGLTATTRVKGDFSPERWEAAAKAIPMGRAAQPGDIAEGVAFLARDDNGYLTGQTLHVNGGMAFP